MYITDKRLSKCFITIHGTNSISCNSHCIFRNEHFSCAFRRVIYFSIHRYENGEFWPNLRESNFHFVGDDLGQGYNFNVPLNKVGMTNADYLAIFQQILLPMAYEVIIEFTRLMVDLVQLFINFVYNRNSKMNEF